MKMLDGLLAQDTRLFLFGLVAHLGVWAISFLASHMETVFHYRAQRQINELERKDMVEMLLKKAILNTMQKKADLIYQDSRMT